MDKTQEDTHRTVILPSGWIVVNSFLTLINTAILIQLWQFVNGLEGAFF